MPEPATTVTDYMPSTPSLTSNCSWGGTTTTTTTTTVINMIIDYIPKVTLAGFKPVTLQ
jgi:hypothetical protein